MLLVMVGVIALVVGFVVSHFLIKRVECKAKNKCCSGTVKKIFKMLKDGGSLPATVKKASDLCFHGDSLVEMNNGSFKKIKELRKGDIVKTETGFSKVRSLIVSQSQNNKSTFVNVNGLLVTPWHPVKVNGEWKFPSDLGETFELTNDLVYNLVLEQGHIININGVKAVTLGHNLTGPVVGHEYFGSQRIINDMKKMRGWDEGLLFLYGVRENSKTINNIVQKQISVCN